MIVQGILLRLLSSRWAGAAGRALIRKHTWTVESGPGAGLHVQVRSNLDYIHGASEVPVQGALVDHLAKGDVFYDIGANTGFFSLLAADRVGADGAVYAFEPVTENAEVVQKNANNNRFPHLQVFRVAVGRNGGEAELLLSDWDGGAALASSSVKSPDICGSRKVTVAPLDDLVRKEKLRPPTLIKIDVEGVELEVLEGMRETIALHRPVLLCEIDDGDTEAFTRRWRELDEQIAAYGYRVVHLEESYPKIDWRVGHTLALPLADK